MPSPGKKGGNAEPAEERRGESQIRETAIFGGVPIADGDQHRPCGVVVVDTRNGQTVGLIEFEETVQELFDVQLLPGVRFPAVVGLYKDTVQRACVIAPGRDL